ncbi:ubiquinone biosynthesis protein [Chitinibacteraceae bacterium HSL-7]
MDRMIATLTGFPTAIWTVLLGVATLYWIASLAGMVDDGVDMSADSGLGDIAAKLTALGLGQVPLSIVFTLYTLTGWLVSALVHQYLLWLPALLHYALGAVLLLASAAVAIPVTAVALRPLRRLFVTHNATGKAELVGQFCTITTQQVDSGFGRAEIRGSGMPYNIRVSCPAPNTLARGHQAVITDYDAGRDCYTVAEVAHLQPLQEQP